MGAAVIERMMATRPGARRRADGAGAADGPAAGGRAPRRLHPELPVAHDAARSDAVVGALLKALRPVLFQPRGRAGDPGAKRSQHLNAESPRVLFDLSMRLHWIEPQATSPVFVLGAEATNRDPVRRAGDRAPSRRRRRDPSRDWAHADAGAGMAQPRRAAIATWLENF